MIGTRIKEALRTRDKTVNNLADYLGVTEQSVYRYLRDEVEPSISTVMKIAQFTGHSYIYFLSQREQPTGGLPTLRVFVNDKDVAEIPVARGDSVKITFE
jgi:transcriptional regulator with XRE-family HTH domain